MQQRTLTLTAAQILAIDATPIEIVPAPGVGVYLTPVAVSSVLHFGTAAHTLGSAINAYVGLKANGNFILAATAAHVNAGANEIEENTGDPVTGSPSPQAQFENQNINLQAAGAAFVAGDGTLTVTVYYNSSRTT